VDAKTRDSLARASEFDDPAESQTLVGSRRRRGDARRRDDARLGERDAK
jgi:hypothetical protein